MGSKEEIKQWIYVLKILKLTIKTIECSQLISHASNSHRVKCYRVPFLRKKTTSIPDII